MYIYVFTICLVDIFTISLVISWYIYHLLGDCLTYLPFAWWLVDIFTIIAWWLVDIFPICFVISWHTYHLLGDWLIERREISRQWVLIIERAADSRARKTNMVACSFWFFCKGKWHHLSCQAIEVEDSFELLHWLSSKINQLINCIIYCSSPEKLVCTRKGMYLFNSSW